jgi:hypothetical protein
MPLYHWFSEALADYGQGSIIVYAKDVPTARKVARQEYGHFIGGPASYLRKDAFEERKAAIDKDLAAEPTEKTAVFISGSS